MSKIVIVIRYKSNQFLWTPHYADMHCKPMMCLKFKPVGDRGGCCLVSVLLMGERQRGKGTETPGERANKKRLEDEKHHVMETEREGGNGDGFIYKGCVNCTHPGSEKRTKCGACVIVYMLRGPENWPSSGVCLPMV